jgi:tetratricopeptide (TPR) repeat protein
MGTVAAKLKRWEEAARCYEQALAIDRALGNRMFEAISLGLLSNVRVEQQRYEDAIHELEQSLAIGEAIGNQDIVRAAQTNLKALRITQRGWLRWLFPKQR